MTTFEGYKLQISSNRSQFYYHINGKTFLKASKSDDENIPNVLKAQCVLNNGKKRFILLPTSIYFVGPKIYFLFPRMSVDLCTINKKYVMSECDIVFTLRCLLSAIEFMHSKNIIHCDIKLENVVVCPTKKIPKIIDFDYATYNEPIQALIYDEGYGTIIPPEMVECEWNNGVDYYCLGYLIRVLCLGVDCNGMNEISSDRKPLVAKFSKIYTSMTNEDPFSRLGFVINEGFVAKPIRDAISDYIICDKYSSKFMDETLLYSEPIYKNKVEKIVLEQ